MRSGKWRTIAIDPTRRGFAFVVLEGREGLLDWGVLRVSGEDRDARFAERFEPLLERYSPRLLVVEDCRDTRRGERACRWIQLAIALAGKYRMSSATVTQKRVKEAFAEYGSTKHEIAKEVARRFPELADRLPPKRKPWLPEPEAASIFDAMAFGTAAFSALF